MEKETQSIEVCREEGHELELWADGWFCFTCRTHPEGDGGCS